jgi:general secretion pathway protein F
VEAFQYQALDASGRTVTGVIQADTPRQVRAQLRAQGLLPSEVAPLHRRRRGGRRIPASELSLITNQLATLLASGLTVEQSLTALIEQSAEPVTQEVLAQVKAEVSAGQSLASAMKACDNSFPDFYQSLVRGGEESGALATVLQHLATHLDARQAMLQKTGLALIYPAIVVVVAMLVVSGLLVYVVPQVVQVFEHSRQSLPLLTRALIGLSGFLQATWIYLGIAVILAFAGARLALRNKAMQRRWHALLLGLPWLGPLIRSTNTAHFASTLAILVRGGVPMLSALASGTTVMSNLVMQDAVRQVNGLVREGATLARALDSVRCFPPVLVHLVASGEASGQLANMLERAAYLENRALERRLAVFLAVLEPGMILVMGGVVLMIVLAILLPIIELNQLVR